MSSPPTAERKLKLQVVRLPTREKHVITDLVSSCTIGTFQQMVTAKFGVEPSLQALWIGGIPPKQIMTSDPTATIASLGIRHGDSIELREPELDEIEMRQGTGTWDKISMIDSNGMFKRRQMPADNSCQFHSIAYTCGNKQTGAAAASKMRELAANLVASDPSKYNTVLLGSPNSLYQEHILNPSTWGGSIELLLFSTHFQTEIISFDPKALREDVFGDNEEYEKRVFLIYSDDHYDALVYESNHSLTDQAIFSTKDDNAWARARDFILSLHQQMVASGQAVKQTEWRHNKDIKRSKNATQAEAERVKRVAAEKARISVTSADAIDTASVPSSTSTTSNLNNSSSTTATSTLAQASDSNEYMCPTCTCTNTLSARRCVACDAPNPNAPSATTTTSSSPPTSSSTYVSPTGGFNCCVCTAWNERPSPTCSVCGTNQTTGQSEPSSMGEDDVRTPLPQLESQLIGGEDDYPAYYGFTAHQRSILAQSWTCQACTMNNPPNTPCCTACQTPNSALQTAATGASASAAPASSSSSPPTTIKGKIKQMFKAPPPWICERCGKSQPSQLLMCGNCRLPNEGLRMRLATQQQQRKAQARHTLELMDYETRMGKFNGSNSFPLSSPCRLSCLFPFRMHLNVILIWSLVFFNCVSSMLP